MAYSRYVPGCHSQPWQTQSASLTNMSATTVTFIIVIIIIIIIIIINHAVSHT